MHRKDYHIIRRIRFRSWSRKSYAAFCSLASEVTIGQVCKSITDMSLRKSAGVAGRSMVGDVCSVGDENHVEESVDALWNDDLLGLEQQLIAFSLNGTAAAAGVPCMYMLNY